jgi:hypothetical protein
MVGSARPPVETAIEPALETTELLGQCRLGHDKAEAAGPFQEPTYKAIAVVAASSEAFGPRQLPSNVVDIRDAQTAANEYPRIVCGSRA